MRSVSLFILAVTAAFSMHWSIVPVASAEEAVANVSSAPASPKLDGIALDYHRSSITPLSGDTVVIDTVISPYKGGSHQVGLILEIQSMHDRQLSLVDRLYIAQVTLGDQEQPISFQYHLPGFIGTGQYLASFAIVDAETGAPYMDFLPIKDFSVDRQATDEQLLQDATCGLSIKQDPSRHYNLSEGPDIAPNEGLSLKCSQTTDKKSSGTYTLHYRNALRAFGSNSAQNESFASKSVEMQNGVLSFDIDHEMSPQAYDYVFYLSRGDVRVTPYVTAHYVIQGKTATIQGVGYHRDSDSEYAVQVSLTGAATNFPGARAAKSEIPAKVMLSFSEDGSDAPVIEKEADVTLVGGLQQADFAISTSDLPKDGYKGKVRVLDASDGKELAHKEFVFRSQEAGSSPGSALTDDKAPVSIVRSGAILGGVFFAVALLVVIVLRFKGNVSVRASWGIFGLLLLLFAALLFGWAWHSKKAGAAITKCSQMDQESCYDEGSTCTFGMISSTACVSADVAASANKTTTLQTNFGNVSGVYQKTNLYDTGNYSYITWNASTWYFWWDCGNWIDRSRGQASMSFKNTMYLNGAQLATTTWLYDHYAGDRWTLADDSGRLYFYDSELKPTETVTVPKPKDLWSWGETFANELFGTVPMVTERVSNTVSSEFVYFQTGSSIPTSGVRPSAAHLFTIEYVPMATPTLTLAANPSSVSSGGSSTLSWTTTNASSCRLYGGAYNLSSVGRPYYGRAGFGGWEVDRTMSSGLTSGSLAVIPSVSPSTPYYMECWNDTGVSSGEKSVTIGINGSLGAAASCVGALPANAVVYAGDDTGLSVNASYAYSAANTPAMCEFSCSSGYAWDGTACAVPSAPVAPTVSLTVNGSHAPSPIPKGTSNVPVAWSSNASSCGIDSGVGWAGADNTRGPSGSNPVTISERGTYKITCTSPTGLTNSDSVSVEISCPTPSGTKDDGSCVCNTEKKDHYTWSPVLCDWVMADRIDCTTDEKNACRDFNWKEVAP